MPFLNADIPLWHCLVRAEYLYDLRSHHGETVPVMVFSATSVPGRALGWQVMTDGGAVIDRLPITALVHKADAPRLPLDHLQLWDCFSHDVSVNTFAALDGLRVKTILKDRKWYWGHYRFTVDWTGAPIADDPGEGGHKSGHVLALENGCYAIQPNNRILWREPSFVTRPLEGNPGYLTNSHEWRCEASGTKWQTPHSDDYFYWTLTDSK